MSDIEDVQTDDRESILSRHRKEKKELQSKIQALKKTSLNSDKKKKKEIVEEMAKLELNLDEKHANELKDLDSVKDTITVTEPVKFQNNFVEESTSRISKAQKRRDKKALEEKEKQAEILIQQELNKNGPRSLENNAIKSLLKSRNLSIHKIPSDGDCLFNAIIHQLRLTNRKVPTTKILRNLTANFIEGNKDTLIVYMINPDTNDCLNNEEFKKYCDAVRNTPLWGSQIEIRALSNVLKVPIEVLQATGPPTIQTESDFKGPNLIITYHRHMYSLGEHYNSTKPYSKEEDDMEDNDDNGLDQTND